MGETLKLSTTTAVTPNNIAGKSLETTAANRRANKAELTSITRIAAPMILVTMWILLLAPVSLAFSGHLGKSQMGAVALANSIINIFGICPALGLSFACDTLFAQVFGSANLTRVGVYLQRSILVLLLFCAPLCALQLNAGSLLGLIGYEPELCQAVDKYLVHFTAAVPALFGYVILVKYMVTQSRLLPVVVIGCLGNVLNAILHAVFLHVLRYDIEGSALAQMTSWYGMAATLLTFILMTRFYQPTWDGWTVEALQNWEGFLSLAFPGMFMLLFGWSSFELGTLLSGRLGEVQLGIMSILFYVEQTLYMIPYGIGDGIGVRVGHLVGAGNKTGAIRCVRVSMAITALIGLLNAILIVSLDSVIPTIFSSDESIKAGAESALLILAVFQLLDVGSSTGLGILRGTGRQFKGMVVQFVAFYCIGVPIGIGLMLFTDLKVIGYWIGLATAQLIQVSIFIVLIICTDWDKECKKAAKHSALPQLNEKQPLLHATDTTNDDNRYGTAVFHDEEALAVRHAAKIKRSTIACRIFVWVLSLLSLAAGLLIRFR